MNRRNEVIALIISVLTVSAIVGWLATLVPPDFFKDETNKVLIAFGSALAVGIFSSIWPQAMNYYSERPRLKVEHINVKTEREPISLLPELFWFVARENSFLEFVDGNVAWKVSALQINELKYHQLTDLERLIPKYLVRLKATSAWATAFLSLIEEYQNAQAPEAKNISKERMLPYLGYLSSSYEEQKKSSLHNDFATKTDDVIVYLKNTIDGYYAGHLSDLKKYNELNAWVSDALKLGENSPQKINNRDKEVPKINFVIGVSNLGKVPALVKWNAELIYRGKTIKLRMPDSRNFFSKISASDVMAVSFIVDTNKTTFDDNKMLFEDLTLSGLKDVKVVLDLAEGSIATSKQKLIEDDSDLPF